MSSGAEATSFAATGNHESGTGTSGRSATETGDGSDSGGVDPTPILDREPAVSHACSETRAVTQQAAATSARTETVLTSNDRFFVVRTSEWLTVAELELDGLIGTPLDLDTQTRNPIAIVVGDELVTAWTRNEAPSGESLRFARVDGDLNAVVDAKPIPGLAAASVNPAALAPSPSGGFMLLFGEANMPSSRRLRMALLTADGATIGSPLDIADVGHTYTGAAASATPTPDGGYAVAYVAGAWGQHEVFFVMLESDGALRFAPRRVSRAAGDGWTSEFSHPPRPNLLAVGDRFWVAFIEQWTNGDQTQSHAVVKLADVDDQGVSQLHTLHSPAEGKNDLWPSLFYLDDRVGLAWASGSIIWNCGGCIADYDVNLVLIDPDTIVPASNVATHVHLNNGFIGPAVAVHGADLLIASSLDFHALTLPASGTMRCEQSG